MNHDWFNVLKEDSIDLEDDFDTKKFFKNLKHYRAPGRLQFETLRFLIQNTETVERETLKKTFRELDIDKSGFLTLEKINQAFKEAGLKNVSKKIGAILSKLDYDGDGEI